ncbi:glycogen debranching protein GlgX [Propionimicrobium lymphophilum]|uniref:glycogen debranching protein GlgX n=1 Tax=Propionimicrobium lymphophilum TaxID=33012 RepID=UPI0023F529E2|nr:glycogen debranching protein GlgX [Propionimicrobium lymphophilum]
MFPFSTAERDTSLGANLTDDGCSFGLWAPRAEKVELALVDEDGSQRIFEMQPSGGSWNIFIPGVKAKQRYGFRVHGQWAPDKGMRSNPHKLLLDPLAKAITAGIDYSGPIFDHAKESYYVPDVKDSAAYVPLSVVVEPTKPARPIKNRKALSDSVIYELHVRGFTKLHPAVPEHLRGSYAGLAYPAVTDYLKSIGVTAVELLPVHHFISEPFLIRRGLVNYWGYNPIGFFAPHSGYCSVGSLGEQVSEFKAMVSALHDADIEVIIDVVYNHTGEGGIDGPTLCYRGIDHQGYYRLTPDLRSDYDVTGCGNSINTSHDDVLELIISSMRYWVQEMGVDGFRFDLAPELIRDKHHNVDLAHPFKQIIDSDPILSDIKMIAEPWDVGPDGYQIGAWGSRWSEWNDQYRSQIRDYWRGYNNGVGQLATRLSGSSDIFNQNGRPSSASINFVTAHDGFTMRDLTTYNNKHNKRNGEKNHDGSNDNRSCNYGVEGETDIPEINELRTRQVRNMLAMLMLSRGVPMVTAGDEFGRTQMGNNNAYCQDSPIGWVNWESDPEWAHIRDLMAKLAQIRADSGLIRNQRFLGHDEIKDSEGRGLGRYELAWLTESGTELNMDDWHDKSRKIIGMYMSDADNAELIWYYNGTEPLEVTLPDDSWGKKFSIELHTGLDEEFAEKEFSSGEIFVMPARTVVYMKVSVDDKQQCA